MNGGEVRAMNGGEVMVMNGGDAVAAVAERDDGSGSGRRDEGAALQQMTEVVAPRAVPEEQQAGNDTGTGGRTQAEAETSSVDGSTVMRVMEVDAARNGSLAAARKILVAELREQQAERDKVLREEVRRVIAELREAQYLKQDRRRRLEAQVAAEVVRKEVQQRQERTVDDVTDAEGPVGDVAAAPAAAPQPRNPTADRTSAELLSLEQQYQ
ncbi:unnamed protein product [Phytophthora fragariaefolia]|uniref:Unnamed protein product n=1 Tax=Phytophthora fragariaefolia TaxID=1490495 RepID=A0A9W6U3N2_9STRA|nr:unnamed protein product [Phytophthora fragariaefolia]